MEGVEGRKDRMGEYRGKKGKRDKGRMTVMEKKMLLRVNLKVEEKSQRNDGHLAGQSRGDGRDKVRKWEARGTMQDGGSWKHTRTKSIHIHIHTHTHTE